MNELLVEFADYITRHTYKTETGPGLKVIERYELMFANASRLITYESRNGTKVKYSYQWLNVDNETICRWDNTPHFPDFDTFPYHRHVGADEVPEPFPAVSLADVLRHITQP